MAPIEPQRPFADSPMSTGDSDLADDPVPPGKSGLTTGRSGSAAQPVPMLIWGERDRLQQLFDTALETGQPIAIPSPTALIRRWQAEPGWVLIDLAATDNLEGYSALDLLAALGQVCPNRPLPVILIVAPGQERNALEAMKLGAADYLFTADLSAEVLGAKLSLPLGQAPPTPQAKPYRPPYRDLVEHSPDIVERFDCDLRHLYVSPVLAELTGIDTEAILGKTCRELGMDKTMVDAWEAAAAIALATGEKQTIEFSTPTRLGVRHFEMAITPERDHPERGHSGAITSLLCISRDITDRIVAGQTQQQQLREAQLAQVHATSSQDLLNGVLNRINDGIVALDAHHCVTFVNQRAMEITGHSATELIGQSIWETFPEAMGESFYAAYERAIQQQQPIYEEHYYAPYDRWFENRIYPSADGTTIYFTDISDRKTAAASRQQTEQLRHELSLLETTLESILAGYWEIDFVTQTAYMSPSLKRMFGYSDDELPTALDTWQTLILLEDRPRDLDHLTRHLESRGQVPYYNEVRYRHKTGATVWVLCAGRVIAWDEAGQPLRMVGCHVDITALKRAEIDLQKHRAHLQEAQRIGNVGSWEMNLDTQQITWSDQVYVILGHDPTLPPPPWAAIHQQFHPDDLDQFQRLVERAIATGQAYDCEFRLFRPDHTLVYVQIKGERLVDAQGQPTHLAGTVQDISDRKHIEAERQRTEAELQKLALRLSLALKSANIGSWERNLITDEIIWDQCLIDLYGFGNLGLMVGYADWQTRVYAEDWPQVIAAEQALLDHDAPYDLEFRICRSDGSLAWIRSSALVQRDPQGHPLSIIGINYDITASKQAAAELQNLSLRLALALESGGFGSWEWDLATDTILWDQSLMDLYRFAPDRHPTADDWRSRVYNEDLPATEAALQRTIQTNAPYDVEFRIDRGQSNGGDLRWVKSNALVRCNAQGEPLSLIGINYDITDQKRAETQLRDLTMRLELALESGGIGTWEIDLVSLEATWDGRMYTMYGLAPSEAPLTFHDWRRFVSTEDVDHVDAIFAEVLAGSTDSTVEFRVLRGDGEQRWIRATALVQYDNEGQPRRLIGTNVDITEAKQAEVELLRTTAQLAASNRELEAFAYSVSHDLRAPLRAIDGFSRALVEDYGDQFGDEGRDYFDRIRYNVGRMGQLIEDLLRLSRVSRLTMTYTSVNLNTLVQDQIDSLRATDPDRTVVVTLCPDVVVSADRPLIQMAIANLVQNAWKFTAHRPTAHLEFGTLTEDEEPVYFVRDDGAGFDMAYVGKLFGVFQRLHNSDEFPGTGIGLATVQRVIHRHGGRVWAQAGVNQGATFYFTLPQQPLNPEPVPSEPSSPKPVPPENLSPENLP